MAELLSCQFLSFNNGGACNSGDMHDCNNMEQQSSNMRGIGCYMVVTTLRQLKFIDKVVPTMTRL